jgi:hypothetical protein
VSGGQPLGGRIRAGVEQRDPPLIAAEEAASRDDGTNDLLVGDMLRTNELQERR